MITSAGPVLYFDGVCNLCNNAVQCVIKHDKQNKFRFASLQSHAGEMMKKVYKERFGKLPDSLILAYNGKLFSRSDAALHTALLINKWAIWSKIALAIPKFIRNMVYDLVARNRYNWFGKKDECMVPTDALKSRFLS